MLLGISKQRGNAVGRGPPCVILGRMPKKDGSRKVSEGQERLHVQSMA